MEIITVPINTIKPYWRNPRKNQDAIDKIAASIEQYGYQRPITVDQDHVIITGHTRYAALRQLGVEEVEIIVLDHLTTKKANEFRIVDNKTGEYSDWSWDKLEDEFKDLNKENVSEFFEAFELDALTTTPAEPVMPSVENNESYQDVFNLQPEPENEVKAYTQEQIAAEEHRHNHVLVCPHCYKDFEVE